MVSKVSFVPHPPLKISFKTLLSTAVRNRRERVKEAQKILKGKIQMILNGEKSQTNSYLHHSSWKYSKVSFNTNASEASIVHLQIKHIWIFAPKIYFRTFCNWHEKFILGDFQTLSLIRNEGVRKSCHI